MWVIECKIQKQRINIFVEKNNPFWIKL
jgi:hypothetical protein